MLNQGCFLRYKTSLVKGNYHVNSDDFYLTLFKTNLFLWRHFDISSILLFNRTFGSAREIIILSVRHKSHLRVPHLHRDVYNFILHFRC